MSKKKRFTDSINNTGNRIRNFGTIISVIGAIVLSVGVVVKYLTKQEN